MGSIFDRLKNFVAPPAKVGQPLWEDKPALIPRELINFKDTFRIGLLGYCTDEETHNSILKYKKELDNLGYETEALIFVDAKELPRFVMLPHITWDDIDKNKIPFSPRPDRFVKKKFDLLLNLYFEETPTLNFISSKSVARCRVGAYRDYLKEASDVFVYTKQENDLLGLIEQINLILQKQAYARKVY